MELASSAMHKRSCALMIDVLLAQVVALGLSLLCSQNLNWLVIIAAVLLRDVVNGQSPGRRLVGLQVVDENNAPLAPSRTIARNFPLVIPLVLLAEYALLLVDLYDGKRLGDRWMRARVCDLRPQIKDWVFGCLALGLAGVMVLVKLGIVWTIAKLQPDLLFK